MWFVLAGVGCGVWGVGWGVGWEVGGNNAQVPVDASCISSQCVQHARTQVIFDRSCSVVGIMVRQ